MWVSPLNKIIEDVQHNFFPADSGLWVWSLDATFTNQNISRMAVLKWEAPLAHASCRYVWVFCWQVMQEGQVELCCQFTKFIIIAQFDDSSLALSVECQVCKGSSGLNFDKKTYQLQTRLFQALNLVVPSMIWITAIGSADSIEYFLHGQKINDYFLFILWNIYCVRFVGPLCAKWVALPMPEALKYCEAVIKTLWSHVATPKMQIQCNEILKQDGYSGIQI